MSRLFFLIIAIISPYLTYGLNIQSIEKPRKTIDIPDSPAVLISSIIAYAIGIAWVLGVMGITWWGIQMILSVGEDEKQKKARSIIIYSIVWVILAGLAYGIVSLVSSLKISF
jgi:hypothetical protein